jgi:hypothetical protein
MDSRKNIRKHETKTAFPEIERTPMKMFPAAEMS